MPDEHRPQHAQSPATDANERTSLDSLLSSSSSTLAADSQDDDDGATDPKRRTLSARYITARRPSALDDDDDEQHPLSPDAAPAKTKHDQPVTWLSLPQKSQLAVLTLARLSEPLSERSLAAYMFYQLRWFDPSLPDSTITSQGGLLTAVFAAAQFFTAIWWGRAADTPWIGRKKVLLVGLTGTAIASIGVGFSRTFYQALLCRGLAGALNGNIGALINSILCVLFVLRSMSLFLSFYLSIFLSRFSLHRLTPLTAQASCAQCSPKSSKTKNTNRAPSCSCPCASTSALSSALF